MTSDDAQRNYRGIETFEGHAMLVYSGNALENLNHRLSFASFP